MYRALPVSKQVASTSSRQCVRVVRRRLATEAGESAPPKATKLLRRVFLTTSAFAGTFYVGSAFVAYNNQAYYEIFRDRVPLGQSLLEYGESHGWDTLTVGDVVEGSVGAVTTTYTYFADLVNGKSRPSEPSEKGKVAIEKKPEEPRASPFKVIKQTTTKVEPTVQQTKTKASDVKTGLKQQANKVVEKAEVAVEKAGDVVKKAAENVETAVKDAADKVHYEFDELVRRAEAAVAGKTYEPTSAAARPSTPDQSHIYTRPLPLGHEPPIGYSRPAPPPKPKAEGTTKAAEPEPIVLPLVAPAVSTSSEPIITHLAGTIDNLASYLKSDPNAAKKAGDVLETAKGDLAALVDRIDAVKEQERTALEAKLDEQTREYTLKLMELEMEAQDKLDSQEDGFKQLFEQERARFIQAYREKLDHELRVQTELINERLKEEVIAQGIELQRRWIREIKVRVEEERGGRLAKLDELAANLKRLERIALDNSSYLDENIRAHALWSAFRALTNNATSSPVRKPFREELRVLRHITAAREDPIVSVVLDSLEKTDVPDVGVEPFADLATWFTTEVAPKVSQVALVPDENAGVLSYLASSTVSRLRFRRQGLVPGDDVLSVLARAEYYLNEKNLDSATRELNQLKGPAKVLLHDWLEAARRRLEVQQALDVVHTQATLASLLVV